MRYIVQNRVGDKMVEEAFSGADIEALKNLDMVTFKGSRGFADRRTMVYSAKRS